jgi:hypothetical protein
MEHHNTFFVYDVDDNNTHSYCPGGVSSIHHGVLRLRHSLSMRFRFRLEQCARIALQGLVSSFVKGDHDTSFIRDVDDNDTHS